MRLSLVVSEMLDDLVSAVRRLKLREKTRGVTMITLPVTTRSAPSLRLKLEWNLNVVCRPTL